MVPPTYADFTCYFEGMLSGPVLQVGESERALKEHLFNLPPEHFLQGLLTMEDPRPARALFASPRIRRLGKWVLELLTGALLPGHLAEAFGLRCGAAERRQFQLALRLLRGVVAAAPPAIRFVPAYHRAVRRVALARGEPLPLSSHLHRLAGRVAIAVGTQLFPSEGHGSGRLAARASPHAPGRPESLVGPRPQLDPGRP
jgi:uncharacterized protein (DUF2236 family)